MEKIWLAKHRNLELLLGMGLDTVELVMAFEEEFGIEISDSEAEEMRTIGDTVDCIYSKITATDFDDHHFEEHRKFVRRSVQEALGSDLPFIENLPLTQLVPLAGRWRKWKKTCEFLDEAVKARHPSGMGSAVPDLQRHSGFVWLIWIAAAICAIWIGFFTESFGLAIVSLLVAAGILLFVSRPLKYRFPHFCQTVGDLERLLVSKKEALLRIKKGGMTRESIKDEVAVIVADQLGVDIGQCAESARYVEDLGVA